ncbi:MULTISPECIES: response regulator transcription factor [Planktothricoides]|uniref:Response regulator transcription factor n=2 Tax=Planktothricoides raciborskii TaxID=132608 RepID=A0AAU8J9C7_9CYAN|nr:MULTISPECIES: response regulator transcription factor [Planktothricoides]KOR35374.1 transcriptional regulator [Planktothricoides sp. SR001]MBD2546005.1 response regulator transcription factor [Planktothricoides raciborskii FACHB-1370]MBD2583350.1 response regulator transcription factor [Planktothricoides raciborskii FACHB-1261]
MASANTPAKILVVDDEPAIRNLIHRFLSKEYQMESAEDGNTAIAKFELLNPDLVILDVNLPDTTGYELCKEMQSRTNVFVLMLTSRGDEADKIKGFSLGADDYITKPFSLVELGARVKAILKRPRIETSSSISQNLEFGELKINPVKREVALREKLVSFTALEFDLLHFLASHPNRVWRRSELLQKVWQYDYVGDQRVVDVHIGQIRRKVDPNGSRIKTVRGVGYKFIPDELGEEQA